MNLPVITIRRGRNERIKGVKVGDFDLKNVQGVSVDYGIGVGPAVVTVRMVALEINYESDPE